MKGWGKNKMCMGTSNNKLEEVSLKIIKDEECRKAAGTYMKYNYGYYAGKAGMPDTKFKDRRHSFSARLKNWTPVCNTSLLVVRALAHHPEHSIAFNTADAQFYSPNKKSLQNRADLIAFVGRNEMAMIATLVVVPTMALEALMGMLHSRF